VHNSIVTKWIGTKLEVGLREQRGLLPHKRILEGGRFTGESIKIWRGLSEQEQEYGGRGLLG
jgi:hypothetical protein